MTQNAHEGAQGAFLAALNLDEARGWFGRNPTVVLPFAAAAKPHGNHLPMNTDAIVMEHLLQAAVAQREVLVAPAVTYGWFPAFRALPGGEVADAGVFQSYVQQAAESLVRHGGGSLVLLNLGVARATGLPLGIVARSLALQVPTLLVSWDDLETDEIAQLCDQQRGGHADEVETSLLLHLAPQTVRMDAAVTDYSQGGGAQIGYLPKQFDGTGSGIYGDPKAASRAKGERFWQVMCDNWLRALGTFIEHVARGR